MKKRHKILSIILALVIALGSIVTISIVSSSAEEFTDNNGISWTVTKNNPGWAIKPTDKSAITGHVVIPSEYNGEPINMIDSNAFAGYTELTSVTIPDSVVTISSYAFSDCTNLTNIDLGNGLKTIGNSVFRGCTSLNSLELPNSVTSIGSQTFQSCTGLTSITIPDSVLTIDTATFKDCTNLTSIKLSNNLDIIQDNTFSGCTSLSNIEIPNGVAKIAPSAFNGCSNLTSVTIPDSVTTLGKKAFYGCTSLATISVPNSITSPIYEDTFLKTAWYSNQPNGIVYLNHICLGYKNTKPTGNITIPEGITVMADSAFYSCTGITSVSLPNSLVGISDSAFYGCTGLTSVTIPDNVTTIGSYAFNRCTKLANVNLGSGVNVIGTNAFSNCTALTTIEIPESVTTIGTCAFQNCTNLENIKIPVNASYTTTSFQNTAWYNSQSDGLLYLDNVLIGYKNTKPTGNITISEGTVAIASSAFAGCAGLTSITIPDSVLTIGKAAFSGCTSLSSVDLGSGVQTIGDSAFYNCTELTSIEIPDSVNTIENAAFTINSTSYKSKLSNVVLGNGVQVIGDTAFANTKITSIKFPNTLKSLGAGAFVACKALTEIEIPNSVTTIGDSAFSNCTNATTLTIGTGVKDIKDYAFYHCTSITDIEIPDSVETIGFGAFEGCSNISTLVIPNSIISADQYAFAECGLIENFNMNCSFDVLEGSAFYNDTFLNVVIGSDVDSIGDEFSNMKDLENIVIPNTVTNIKDTAFVGSPNVTITTTSNTTANKFANANNIPVNIIDAVNTVDPVSFEVTCDKPGYEFTVYKVADLVKTENPYEVRYDSLLTDIEDEIFEGNSEALLSELDKVDSNLLTEVVGTYSTDEDGASKLFENLEPGIYYVRATNFPANVYSVQNSVFALPYYDATEGWIYEIAPIPLATKVDESNPEIVKTITNSTKDNVNFTDVSLGDTVNFEIEASRVGSANVVESKDFRLNSYIVSDIMENGLTLNQDSFVVTLEDADGNTLTTLEDTTDYVVNVVASEGADTTFTVSLTPEYLQEDEFYSSANVVIAYSAVLNKYSTREFDGNYNTATNLTYSNKTNVSATVEGNTVYAYTFGIEVNKYDDAGTPLAGSQFGLYLTEDDAKAMANAIATGTSTDTGKVEFFTESNDVIRLASGTYYIVETKATESYNRYTDVIPVTITVNYGDTEVNGTYIESAPENGIQLVEVKNSKVVIPNTGGDGAMYRYIIALAFAMLAVALFALKKRSSKKATAIK